ncbi:MAG TPA: HEAT repeat domain-containing protein [Anaerolineaceae bacterium]|nr:HEAT repeat domain-containing protein [Anaerolineaceae bacterium]
MKEMSPKVPFETVTSSLLDMDHQFPPIYLHRFSDLTPNELWALKSVWADVPIPRRRTLMESLEEAIEADTLLDFHDLGIFTLEDSDPQVRSMAIRLLWEDEDKNLADLFTHLLEHDEDTLVRSTAASALGFFVYQGEVDEIPEDLLHEVEDALLRAATGRDDELIRRRALESLGYSSREEVPALIEAAFHNSNPEWISSALFAMGRSADGRWADDVIDSLDHPVDEVRIEAVRAAGELQLGEAREALLKMLDEEEDDDIRLAAIWSLSQVGGEGVRSRLEELLEETDDDEEADLIEDALENLSFTEDVPLFDLFDYNADEVDYIDEEGNPIDKPADSSSRARKKKG